MRVSFTQARIQRAIRAAKKEGMRVVLRPNGSITFEDPREGSNPQGDESLEDQGEVVL